MPKHQPTILIVDDEAWGRDGLEALLLNQGYTLAFAANGQEALTQAAALIPDLILLDVMMPELDGFEVCRRLRADPILADVPVVLVTALDDRDSRLQGIEAGADDFVTKPFDRAELRTRVRTITRLNRFRRLLAERAKFEWVVEQAEDGYLLIDDSGQIHYANHKGRLHLGLPLLADEPVTESFHQLVRKQYHAEPENAWAIWPDHASQHSPRFLVRPESQSSQPFWLQVATLQLDLPPNPHADNTLWVVQLRDITAQMAQKTDKWQFQAMVSHKFRTPLIPLITGLDLIRKYANKLSTQEIMDVTERAYKGISRLHSEIEDILQYVNASKSTHIDKKLTLDQLEAVVMQLARSLELTQVSVAFGDEVPPGETPVNVAHHSAELIFRELLENAKKFHPQQTPAIHLVVSRARFGESIMVTVTDNGLHLSSEQLTQVWTPYYQGEKYFTGEAGGMGLGLAMVASTVWNAGGRCRMYNRLDQPGIVVELSLPLVQQA
jgi:DNA-binding response OmpR family regulator